MQAGIVDWALTDNQNTVRDLATYNSGTNTTTVVNHRVFSAYGQLLSQTNAPAADCLFAYTGRALDQVTGLQNNLNRWYDSITARWLSQDPVGLGPDANPYRYCGNAPTGGTDASGLASYDAFPVNPEWGTHVNPDAPHTATLFLPPAPAPAVPESAAEKRLRARIEAELAEERRLARIEREKNAGFWEGLWITFWKHVDASEARAKQRHGHCEHDPHRYEDNIYELPEQEGPEAQLHPGLAPGGFGETDGVPPEIDDPLP